MSKVIECACGRRYPIPEGSKHKEFRCPHCGALLAIPPGPAAAPEEAKRGSAAEVSAPDPSQSTSTAVPAPTASLPDESESGPPVAMPPGETGRYEVVREHARGGVGRVSIARDQYLEREVAYKDLLEDPALSPARRDRLIREARLTGQLEHPGVVPVYGIGLDAQGRPFYTMKFLRGKTLMEAIAAHRRSRPAATPPPSVLVPISTAWGPSCTRS